MPLPPGTKIQIELDKNDDEFIILKDKTDPEKYQFKILNIALFIPIAQLSQSVYAEFSTLLTKPKELQSGAVNIHYRRAEVRAISIPSNSQEFHSDILFTGESPVRIVLVLVNTKAKNGQYDLNGFEFRRKWHFKKKKKKLQDIQENLTEKQIFERRIRQLEIESQRRIQEIQARFETLQNQLLTQPQSKGKGRGKRSSTATLSLNQAFDGIQLRESTSSSSSATSFERISVTSAQSLQNLSTVVGDDPDPPPDPDPEEDDIVYIKKIELLINGTPVDQVLFVFIIGTLVNPI